MSKTTRRDLLKAAGAGSVAAGLGAMTKAETVKTKATGAGAHDHRPLSGLLASATVSFGQWLTDDFDRTLPQIGTNPTTGPNSIIHNSHLLTPNEVVIRAGGSVNFIVAGFHQIAIYGNGKKPEDVNTSVILPPVPPGFIDDPANRIFRGVNPTTVPQDRVEVVTFAKRGRYLVICTVLPHFRDDDMYGWVTVLP